ncbi:MAG TPA: hypothetical protein VIS49_07180 [Cyclobacteriaceae bacterium]
MFVPFEELSPTARVWIYQLDRSVNEQEKSEIEKVIKGFCHQWQAHGAPLRTSFQLIHDHFLVLAVDEKAGIASGCSIDGSVRVLKELSERYNIDFFNRTLATFLIDDEVVAYPLNQLKGLFSSGTLSSTATTFNNLVESKAAFLENWMVPVGKSWLSKYLPKSTLA